jgi:hypothetical protein
MICNGTNADALFFNTGVISMSLLALMIMPTGKVRVNHLLIPTQANQ